MTAQYATHIGFERRKHEVLAIIPARGGSKGIYRKNIVDLGGKPLLAWTIESAIKAKKVTRVVVSTEDREIADIAREYGAEVPFLRSREAADDVCSTKLAAEEMLFGLARNGYEPDASIQLYPTSPFREPDLIDYLVGKLFSGFQQVCTVRPVTVRAVQSRSSGRLKMLSNMVEGACRYYGLFSGICYHKYPLFTYWLHRIENPVALIDIDTLDDLELARTALRQGWTSWIPN